MGMSFRRNDYPNTSQEYVTGEMERDFLKGGLDTRRSILDGQLRGRDGFKRATFFEIRPPYRIVR